MTEFKLFRLSHLNSLNRATPSRRFVLCLAEEAVSKGIGEQAGGHLNIRTQSSILARQCSLKALEQLQGVLVSLSEVITDADGVPTWPKPYLGSLSHTYLCDESKIVAVALMAESSSEIHGVGVDIETKSPRAFTVRKKILTPGELDWVERSEERATRLFGAKEAIYKAVFPTVRRFFGFHEAELQSVNDRGHWTCEPYRHLDMGEFKLIPREALTWPSDAPQTLETLWLDIEGFSVSIALW